jgi:diamine N-acetyltransferase
MARLFKIRGWPARQQTAMPPTPMVAAEDQEISRTGRSDRPVIRQGRLTTFRRFREVDAPELLLWGEHDDILLESYNMGLRSREDALRWFGIRQGWLMAELFAVDSLSEGRVVGYIGLREIDIEGKTSVLGISFDPAALGRGYGTDALQTFLGYYFEEWEFEAMLLDVAGPNIRAQRSYEKCGFRYTGEHWKPFSGHARQALKSPLLREYPERFRLNGGSLSMLFYDMKITREQWLHWTGSQ